MGKLIRLRVPISINKKNGQINLPLPKKKLNINLRNKSTHAKFARIFFEDFE